MGVVVEQLLRSLARSLAVPPIVVLLIQGVAPGSPASLAQLPSSPLVLLKTNKGQYGVNEPVTVVITNMSRSPVTLSSGGFSCTVVRLEQKTSEGWTPVENCFRVSVPIPEVLGPGLKRTLTFPPRSEPGIAGRFPRGTFHFLVIFEVYGQPDGGARDFGAYSEPFTVQ